MREIKLTQLELNSSDKNVEINLKGNGTNLDIIFKAIQLLIDSIDMELDCDDDPAAYEDVIEKLFYVIADRLGFKGEWYHHNPAFTVKYEGDSDEGYVSVEDKKRLIEMFLNSRSNK